MSRLDQDGPDRPHDPGGMDRRRSGEREDAAVAAFRAELDQGYFAVVSQGEGHAEQVRELPLEAPVVILRRPIAGG